ncbi:hypothetical protein Bbelb_136670 [Branchiostoma belcheri]|nr:hypothetical protein Bbelb_136670 [Branchiostoma belcheri]
MLPAVVVWRDLALVITVLKVARVCPLMTTVGAGRTEDVDAPELISSRGFEANTAQCSHDQCSAACICTSQPSAEFWGEVDQWDGIPRVLISSQTPGSMEVSAECDDEDVIGSVLYTFGKVKEADRSL